MKPTKEQAQQILMDGGWGNSPMPESKIKHSTEMARVAGEIAERCGLDKEYVQVLALFHDIGCHQERGHQHPIIGYKHLISLGIPEEYARICLTHSFIGGDVNCTAEGLIMNEDGTINPNVIVPYENEEDQAFLLEYLKNHTYTPEEEIINLCDLMVSDKMVGLDVRLDELEARKGTHVTSKNFRDKAYGLLEKIKRKMSDPMEMEQIFPEVIENAQTNSYLKDVK